MLGKMNILLYYLFKYPCYKLLFAKMGSRARLVRTKVDGYKRISIGSKVFINDKTWLACMPLTGNTNCSLSIGDGTYVGRFCHFYATSKIEIGKKVLIADRVYLADNLHDFSDITKPVIDQPVKQTGEVMIGDGAWLGENVCIIGAKIGKQSVVGANSVVMKDIPDYCVAVGTPARIVKRYSFEKKEWLKTNEQGEFLM
jgi:acetyltransferase-like isoleucine patch superfamily enzyme